MVDSSIVVGAFTLAGVGVTAFAAKLARDSEERAAIRRRRRRRVPPTHIEITTVGLKPRET